MKPDGFMVFESCEDYEQALGLEIEDGALVSAGLLTWRSENVAAALFATKSDARRAIDRTEHVRRALLLSEGDDATASAMPEAKQCKIVPVVRAKPAGSTGGEA